MKSFNFLTIAGLIVFILYSCREKSYKNISEGEIHYSIEYLTNTGSVSNEFKPKTLVVTFKNDKILFEILSPIGNQGIINIVNPEKGIFDTYVNMLGTKFYYSAAPDEIYPGFSWMDNVIIRKTQKTTVICGYECNHAEAVFPSMPGRVYDIWYTDEIKVKNSNASTPFRQIDGVLMSFYYILGGSEMKFEAEAVYKKTVSDKIFERRPKYKLISKKDMDKIISDIVNL